MSVPLARTSSEGGPSKITRPPSWPAPGPRSMTQSERATTSRLCSITTTVLPGIDQPVQQADEVVDVVHVQPGGRLVEDVDVGVAAHLDRELQALPLPARQRVQHLPERDVAEADIGQAVEHHLHRLLGEELRRLLDGQVEHLGDVQPAQPIAEDLIGEALALADLADAWRRPP